jgi:hydroxyethylthiazole kinase-like uncharacterized protein yjeF
MHTTPVFLTEHIRALEQTAFAQDPPAPLMQRAGLATAELARQVAGDRVRRILVLAGPGNNGGDALIAAGHLKRWWFDVCVVFTGDAARLKADAKAAFDGWTNAGGTVSTGIPGDFDWQLAVDGLFGIGLQRELDERHTDLVHSLNDSDRDVIAIDVPSGIDADNGQVMGAAVRATHTITFMGLKAGLHTLDGPDHAGTIHLAALGIDELGIDELGVDEPGIARMPLPDGHGYLIGDDVIASALPPRLLNSHKGRYGDVAIIGGTNGMVGAALLAGRAALKMGAGRVLVGMLGDGPVVDFVQPEVMIRRVEELLDRPNLGALVIGPGLGQSDVASHVLSRAMKIHAPIVLDADALNLLASSGNLKDIVRGREQATLLTPHPAEAARLLSVETDWIQGDRIAAAQQIASEFEAYVVLKGCGSVCAFPEGTWCINTSGNPGMASAGMGDVLSGIIGALLAQGTTAHNALLAGVHVHGMAADDLVANGIGPLGLTASETIDAARSAWNRCANS